MRNTVRKYNDLVEEVSDIKSVLEDLESSLEIDTESVNDINERIKYVQENELAMDSPLIMKEFNRLLAEYKSKLDSDTEAVNKELKIVMSELESKKLSVYREVTSSIQSLDKLRTLYNRIQLFSEIGTYAGDVIVPDETITALEDRLDEFEKYYKSIKEDTESLPSKMSNLLSLNDVFKSISNKHVNLVCMTAYIAGSVTIICKLPLLFLTAYSTLTVLSFREAFKKREKLNNAKVMYKAVCQSYNSCQTMVQDEYDEKSHTLIEDLENEYQIKISTLSNQLNDIKNEYDSFIKDLNDKRNDPEAFKSILEKSHVKIQDLNKRLDRMRKKIDATKLEIEENIQLLSEKQKTVNELKDTLTKNYIKDLDYGKSRVMIDDIFIGFNSDDSASMIEFDASTLIIGYRGKDSTEVAPLTIAIIMEILTNVNISSISIDYIDVLNGGIHIAPLIVEELSSIIQIYRNNSEYAIALKSLNDKSKIKSANIATKANTIRDFNRIMLEKNSLTEEYNLLVVQDGGDQILGNAEFLQLCRLGPSVGIIPIVMLSLDTLAGLCNGTIKSGAEAYQTFLSNSNAPIYEYNPKNKTVRLCSNSFKESYLNKLQSVIKKG